MALLDTIDSPDDLSYMSVAELTELAGELRARLLEVIGSNGGHLSSNLGVVELTIALHRSFRSPRDKIVFDTSHQSYAHKLLTGRKARFHTLRQHGGLSGYQDRDESEHDCWGSGHASTSLSAAAGFAAARDHRGEQHHVVAVVGDAALSGGMALEALNLIGNTHQRCIVVLNDNGLAYAPTRGALAAYTARQVARAGLAAPIVCPEPDPVRLDTPSGAWFEELGYAYVGPVDGHDVAGLLDAFERAAAETGPVLVHVVTTKGKGFAPAEGERDAELGAWHGVGPFDPGTGRSLRTNGAPTWSSVFGSRVLALAQTRHDLVAITAAMTLGTGLGPFRRAFPDRFVDVGICEQHAVTMAAAMAAGGLKPLVAIYSTFLQRAFDQVLHDVCRQGLPVVFCLDRAGLVEDGPTAHGLFDIAYLRPMPNLVLMAPGCTDELEAMLDLAMQHTGPVALRYPRGKAYVDTTPSAPIVWGRASVALDFGEDVALVSYGACLQRALDAARLLKHRGIRATVVNARFAKPLDVDLLVQLAQRTGHVITIEEGVVTGGFGSAVGELLHDECRLDARLDRLGLPDAFIEHGTEDDLRHRYGLDAAGIAEAIAQQLRRPVALRAAGGGSR